MSSYKTKKTPGNTEWFEHDRFGMFIHWGLYSMPARHEWIKTHEQISEEKYDKYFKYFNPDMYDAREWARRAKAAGMKYAVLTTKHHEGFCLFDSKYTDYKSTNTPAGRDLVREYVEAFRAEGLRVGFYYSLIDWHHPDFPVDVIHPRRDDNPEEMNKTRDIKKYAQYMRDQVTELLTNYGKIDILWFDFSYINRGFKEYRGKYYDLPGKGKDDWEAEKLLATARSLQPEIIIDNRTDILQDLWTPEQTQPLEWVRHGETGELVTWEACQTFSGAWGYHRDELTWKNPKMLIDMLVNTVCIGGNLLMNVGPTMRGYFDHRAEKSLDVFAKWMKYNSRAIYGCTQAEPEFTAPRDCRLTQSQDGKRLYLHIMNYPFKAIQMDSLLGKVDYAQFLHDGSEVQYVEKVFQDEGDCKVDKDSFVFNLPVVPPEIEVPVIEIFLK